MEKRKDDAASPELPALPSAEGSTVDCGHHVAHESQVDTTSEAHQMDTNQDDRLDSARHEPDVAYSNEKVISLKGEQQQEPGIVPIFVASSYKDMELPNVKATRGMTALRPGVVSVGPNTLEEPTSCVISSSHSNSHFCQTDQVVATSNMDLGPPDMKPSRGMTALHTGAVSFGPVSTFEEPTIKPDVMSDHSSYLRQTEEDDGGGAFKPKSSTAKTVQQETRNEVEKKRPKGARGVEAVKHHVAKPATTYPGAVAVTGTDGPSPVSRSGTSLSAADYGVADAPDVDRGTTTISPFTGPDENEGLAVALPISEQDGDAVRVHGTEYDPEAKPPLFKSRRGRLYIFGAVVLVLAIVGGVLGGVLGSRSSSPSIVHVAPTLAPSTFRELQYYDRFAAAIGNQGVFQEGTPYQLAAEWITQTDPMQLSVHSNHLIQRFVLTLFYYQMTNNGKQPWRSCYQPTAGQNDTCEFLMRNDNRELLANGTVYDNITYIPETINPDSGNEYYRWLSGAHECLWAGNICDNTTNVLQTINLYSQNLTGTLPTEIAVLSTLLQFSVTSNLITGTIPSDYAKLKSLAVVELDFNLLTGSFPDAWYHSTALLDLNLAQNMITGTLSSELGLLSNLEGLFLFQNKIHGTIPTEIGNLNGLQYTQWYGNPFVGTIPTEIGNLKALQELYLYDTSLSGTIPSEIGLLTQLSDLRMSSNGLHGTIPKELYNLNNLTYSLDFSDNMNLTGTLSTRIGNLKSLETLFVSNNHFTGTVPTELALLTVLEAAWLYFNDFNGTIPTELCKRRGLAVNNMLQVLVADCGPQHPLVSCECCSECCDRTTGICLTE